MFAMIGKRGFSLVELMVGTAIFSIVMLGAADLLVQSFKAENSTEARAGVESLVQQLKTMLNSPQNCLNAFGPVSVNTTGQTSVQINNPLIVPSTVLLYASPSATQNLIEGQWQITAVTLTPTSEAVQTFDAGYVDLFASLSFVAVSPSGKQKIPRSVPLTLRLVAASGLLNSCTITAGQSTGEVVLPVCGIKERLALVAATPTSDPVWTCRQ